MLNFRTATIFKTFALMLFLVCQVPLTALAQTQVTVSGDDTINRCETKPYNIRFKNDLGNTVSDLTITAKLANLADFSYEAVTAHIEKNDVEFCTADPTPSGSDLVWIIDAACTGATTLEDGEFLDVRFNLTTDCDALSGTLNTRVDYTLNSAPVSDPTGAHSIEVLPGAVTITKTPSVIPKYFGEEVTWTIAVQNSGLGVIKNVEVTDTLGDGLLFSSATESGANAGQVTTWTSAEHPGLASMNPGEVLTMDITAIVNRCTDLENVAEVRFGCNPSPAEACFDTAADGGTATAAVKFLPRSPKLVLTPEDVTIGFCESGATVTLGVENDAAATGTSYNTQICVDPGPLTFSNVQGGASYNTVTNCFENIPDLAPRANFDLVFDADYGDFCGDVASGTLIYVPDYTDECGNHFYPTPVTGAYALGTADASLEVDKTGPATMYIGAQADYDITVTYNGPVTCGDPANPAGLVTVTYNVPPGFTVVAMAPVEDGVWTDSGDGTGGQIEWTFDPSVSITLARTITLEAPGRDQCEGFCNTAPLNTLTASVTDCCGCTLSDTASTTTSIECYQDQVLTSGKTASAGPTGPCESMTLTNTYKFLDNPVLNDVELSELVLTENNDNLMEYVNDPADTARVWFHDLGVPVDLVDDEILCFTINDNTHNMPAGALVITFEGCPADSIRDKELIVSYDMQVTDQSQPLPPCNSSHTFYSWTDLDLGPDTPTGECLGLTGVHETVPITVDPPAMQVTMSSLPGLVENCGVYPITITVEQLSAIEPYDVRVVLENANYYAISYDSCGGDVNPTNCGTPDDFGSGVQWNYDDLFVGGATSATIDITVKKRCSDSPDLIARVYYDDLCHDDAAYDNTCNNSDTVSSLMLLKGNIFIDKRPEVVFTEINQVEWTIHVTNAGAGPADNVTISDTLAGGHEYSGSVVVPDNGDVTTNYNPAFPQLVNWVINSMAAGEVRTITINSNLVSCDPLGNTVDATWGCEYALFPDETCQIVDQDASTVEIPTPNLVSTSVTVNTQDMCDVKEATISLRNAGQTHVYELIAAQTLPAGIKYAGNPEYRFWDDSAGTWIPAGPVWTPGPAPNDGGATVSSLVWSHEDGSGAGALALLMDDLDRQDIIEIRFDIETACDFAGGTMQVETQYKNPCMETVTPNSVGTFVMGVRLPELTIENIRTTPAAGDPVNCGAPVTWSIVVTNTGEIAAPVVWVEDTMESGFTFSSSTGGVDGGKNGYGSDPLVTTWEIVDLLPGPTNAVTLTLTANSNSSGSSCEEIDNLVEAFWGCGIPDNDSATKPGMDEGVGDQCLTDDEVQDTDESTRQPTLGYLSVGMSPTAIDSCNDSTELTVVLENTGAVDAHNVDLVITLPPNVTYNAGSSEFGLGVDDTGAIFNLGGVNDPVPLGGTLTYYDIDVKGSANDLTNVIEASGAWANDTVALRFTVQSSCYTTANVGFDIRYYSCCNDTQYSTTDTLSLVAKFPDLAITKTPTSGQPDCGSDQTWEITVTNNGNGQAQIVTIEDSPGDWIDVRTGQSGDPVLLPGGGYGWEIMNLAATGDPGDSQTFTLVGTFNPNAPRDDCADGLRENNVQAVWGCGVGDGDPTTDNTTCEDDTPAEAPRAIVRMPNLVITEITPEIICDIDGACSGSITVRVQNQGDGPTTENFTVAVTDDGHRWTSSGNYTGNDIGVDGLVNVTIGTSGWSPDCDTAYTISAEVDSGGAECECNESDNTFTEDSYTASIPDLTVTGIDFNNIGCTDDGVFGRVDVTIRNFGNAAASNFQVSLGTDGCLTFDNETVDTLAAGETTVVEFSVNVDEDWVDCGDAQCRFTAEVDADDAVCECNGNNNSLQADYDNPMPDLTVTDISFDLSCSGDAISGDVTVTVVNEGPVDANAFEVALETDGCFGAPANLSVPSLAARASTTVTFSLADNWATCSDGACLFTALLDPGEAVCECDGTNNTRVETTPPFKAKLFWSDGSDDVIQQSDRDGGSPETVADAADGLNSPRGVAVDETLGAVYWVNAVSGTIQRADLNGSNVRVVISGLTSPVDIALDPTGGKIYWSDNGDNAIHRADSDGANPETPVSGLVDVGGIALDLNAGKIYWTSPADGKIHRADLNGGTPEILIDTGLSEPYGIAVDTTGLKLYFTDPGSGKIHRAGLDGSDLEDLATGLDNAVYFLKLDEAESLIYFGTNSGSIRSVGFDDTGIRDVITGLKNGLGVALYAPAASYRSVNLVVDSVVPAITCTDNDASGRITVQVSNSGPGDVKGAVVRLTNNCSLSFADQAVDLAADESRDLFFDFTGGGIPLNCGFIAQIDPDNNICECSDADNSESASHTMDNPDLEITDINFDNLGCTDDTISGSIAVTVENLGDVDATGFTISLDGAGCLSFSDWSVASLASRASTTVTFDVTGTWADCTDRACIFTAGIDPVTQCNGGSHTVSETYNHTMADLTVTGIDSSGLICEGDGTLTGSVTVMVANIGFGRADDFLVSLETYGALVFSSKTISLTGGSATSLTFMVDGSGNNSGDSAWRFTATADPGDEECECNGDNNSLEISHGAPLPDLAVTEIDFDLSCSGDAITGEVWVTVKNQGEGNADAFDIALETDGCFPAPTNQTAASLAPGAEIRLAFSLGDSWAACSDWDCLLTATADPGRDVCESDGTNNSRVESNLPFPAKIYWSDGTGQVIRSSGRNGEFQETVADAADGLNSPRGVAVDETLGAVYWVNAVSGTIQRADLDGSNVRVVLSGLTSPLDIALDPADGKMYWSDNGDNAVYRADPDGGNVEMPVSGLGGIGCLALDAGAGKLYWTNPGDGEISRADLDGANPETLIGADLDSPYGIALDITESRIYFSDPGLGKILRTGLDGGSPEDVVAGLGTAVAFLDLDENESLIYFSTGGGTIRSVGFDGTGLSDRVTGLVNGLGVALYTPAAGYRSVNLVVDSVVPAIISADDDSAGSVTVRVSNTGVNGVQDSLVRLTSDCGITFSDQIVDLSGGESRDLFFTFTNGCVGCSCEFTAVIDPNNGICECSDADNAEVVSQFMVLPDLQITEIDFSSVGCTDDGVSGSVSVTVENRGAADVTAFYVSLETAGCLGFSSQTLGHLAPGASTIVTFDITGPWMDCTDQACTFTARAGTTPGFNANSHTYVESYNLTLPDLTVAGIDATDLTCSGKGVLSGSITVTIENLGFGPAENFLVSLETDDSPNFNDQTVSLLGAGASTNLTFIVNPSGNSNANCRLMLTATVDPGNQVCECNGTNNRSSITHVSDLPDLSVSSISPFLLCNAKGGVNGYVKVSLTNTGHADGTGVPVRLTSDCDLVFTDRTADVPLGAAKELVFDLTDPRAKCPRGSCVFTARIDPENRISQCGDGDNLVSSEPYNFEFALIPALNGWGITILLALLAGSVILVIRRGRRFHNSNGFDR